MLKKIIAGAGLLFVTALPLAAQNNIPPLEVQTDENPQYRERHKKRHTNTSGDPKFPAHNKRPGVVDTTANDTVVFRPIPVKKEEEAAPPK